MYREARSDIKDKMNEFNRRHRAKEKELQRKLKDGLITQEQFDSWKIGQVFVGKQWQQKLDSINKVIANVMQEASNLTHDRAIDVFAENANYTAFEIEKDFKGSINFGLYDSTTVSRLIREEPELIPRRVVKGQKLEAWETQKVANAISQGIIQGESIDQIASRIARDMCLAANNNSVLYARTAMTGAQNAGRMERLHEAKDMGINVRKRWVATLDSRTRVSHQHMDGVTVDVDEKFVTPLGSEMDYPGDFAGDVKQADVWNCRCTLVYVYPDFEQNFERAAYLPDDEHGHKQWEIVGDITYDQWKAMKMAGTSKESPKLVKSENEFLTFDTEEDNKRLEDLRQEKTQLKAEYDRINKAYYKTYDEISDINVELAKLDELEKLREQDYSYFDRFDSEEELKQRRRWISSKINELHDKEENLARPRREDFDNEDDYIAARIKWKEERDVIINERMKFENELSKAYNTPRGGWKGIEQWRKARDTDEETLFQQREELQRKKDRVVERREEIDERKTKINAKLNAYDEATLVDNANKQGVQYMAPKRMKEIPSVDKIVSRLGGGDKTEGSCASLGFCYIGQKNGVDVLDFRDGESRAMFSYGCRNILRGIAQETGKPLLIEPNKSGTGGAVRLIKQCQPGKEYYFVVGRHAAIVRKVDDHYEYLELQNAYRNGWKQFGEDEYYRDGKYTLGRTFEHRFACSRHIDGEAMMMDIEDMKNSKLLQRSWGYMNTAEDAQHKGATGHER